MPDRANAVWLALFFAVACAGTWLARRYALHRDLLDHPGERSSHVVPTPRGGGIAIVVALLAACAWLAPRTPGPASWLVATAIGLALVAGIGWIDDHRPLSPWLRLGVHALAAAVLATGLLRAGAPLSEVGQVLRHRSARSTAIYAKVDEVALRPLAKPWPGSPTSGTPATATRRLRERLLLHCAIRVAALRANVN